jgi:predicted nucleic acid-binding Zn ribbon protein
MSRVNRRLSVRNVCDNHIPKVGQICSERKQKFKKGRIKGRRIKIGMK